MKEKLYTIPVMDAFKEECECPVCFMKKTLERNAIEFTLSPSYMEDDIRAKTDKIGFCAKHVQDLYKEQNRLGLALILKTHTDKIISDIENLSSSSKPSKGSLFKKSTASPIKQYIDELESNCFVCQHIQVMFERYIATIFHLYQTENEFKERFSNSKGFCISHYGILYELAPKYLNSKTLDEFIETLNKVFIENMKRVNEDIEWFTNKFDYRYKDAPWKNSRDALIRAMTKVNSVIVEEE